jgi:hypothetical protein
MNGKELKLEASPTRKPAMLKQGDPGRLILFNADDGQYFALDEIGSVVWEHCDGAHTVTEIINHLFDQYEAPRTTIQADLTELIASFTSKNLLTSTELFQSSADGETKPGKVDPALPPMPSREMPLLEKVGTHKSSGKIFFKTKYLEDGREVEKIFYDDDGKVSKTIKYQHDSGQGYSLMEIFNAEGRLILRHQRGKPPEQFP